MADVVQILHETGTYAALTAGGASAPALQDKMFGLATDRDRIVIRDGSDYFQSVMCTAAMTDEHIPFFNAGLALTEDAGYFSYSAVNHRLSVPNIQLTTKIIHIGDDDTWAVYYPAANQINTTCGNVAMVDITTGAYTINEGGADVDFRVEGVGQANALFVQGSDGYLGFGVTAPANRVVLPNLGKLAWKDAAGTGETAYIGSDAGDDLVFYTNSTARVTIDDATGNVGVGTAAPGYEFHLYGAGPQMVVQSSAGTKDEWGIGVDDTTQRWGVINNTSGYGEVLTILRTGPVGIGVPDPDTALEVYAATTQIKCSHDGTYYTTLGTGAAGDFTITPSGTYIIVPASKYLTFNDGDVSNPITGLMPATSYGMISEYNATSGGLRITGVMDADAEGCLWLEGFFGVANPTDTNAAVMFRAGKTDGGTSTAALAAAEQCFQFNNYDTQLVSITGNGYVGINVTAPQRHLHVELENDTTNTVAYLMRLSHFTTSEATLGYNGVGLEFEAESEYGTEIYAAITGGGDSSSTYRGLLKLAVESGDDTLIDMVTVGYSGVIIGAGVNEIDYALTFNGNAHDGVITWMEDEDYFTFGDDINLASGEVLKVNGTQVVTARQVIAALANTPNSGDADTDALIDALRDVIIAHGLGAAA